MNTSRMISIGTLIAACALASAQAWSDSYAKALDALKAERFAEARTLFKQAASLRADDFSGPTSLKGGSVTEPKLWRDGESYSPNFAAAYAAYKLALKTADDAERNALLRVCTAEFKALMAKGQRSREVYYFQNVVLNLLRDDAEVAALATNAAANADKMNWKIDSELLSIEERAAIFGVVAQGKPKPEAPKVVEPKPDPKPAPKEPVANKTEAAKPEPNKPEPEKPGPAPVKSPASTDEKPVVTTNEPKKTEEPKKETAKEEPKTPKKPVKNPTTDDGPPVLPADSNKPKPAPAGTATNPVVSRDEYMLDANGNVIALDNKYALIIGNSESAMVGGGLSFAVNDARYLEQNLVKLGGYKPENILVLTDVTAQEMLEGAASLAERVPENGVVMLYFSGVGVNLEGKDYLGGVDTAMPTDQTTMVAKTDLFQQFMNRGARIFSFFQVSRPMLGGRYFGQEALQLGAISQMQATIPGGVVSGGMVGGEQLGLFTSAMGRVLNEFKSNRIPILEFGWQVFDKIRGGERGKGAGGATQVPTLPQLTNLAPDSRF